jgi:acyl-CoA thioester hydrolase
MRVRFAETDLMGIVHHASYLAYMEVARIEWLRRRGVTYAAWAEQGIHLPVVDLAIKYRAPARFDDEIDVETTLSEVRAATLRFDYRIVRITDGTLCADGTTRLACIDGSLSLKRLSEEIVQALGAPERMG